MTQVLDFMLDVEFDRVQEGRIDNAGDAIELIFYHRDFEVIFKHHRDCCEQVFIEDIIGDLNDLSGSPIVQAEVVTNKGKHLGESATWTFYKFATKKGHVTVRWLGTSNGYYSESVDVVIDGQDPWDFMEQYRNKKILEVAGVE